MSHKKSNKSEPWIRLEQWIEVEINDGQTCTRYYPGNEQLIKIGAKMDPPPDVVFRRFNFPDGVPPEYSWTNPEANHIAHGGAGIQRMRYHDWLGLITREAISLGGHARALGIGFLSRWSQDEGLTNVYWQDYL